MRTRLLVLLFALASGLTAHSFPAYHLFGDLEQAKAEAQQRHLPIAWLGGFSQQLQESNPERGGQAELTQLAIAALQDRAVVVFFDASTIGSIPLFVHMQFHQQDDGPLPNGANWNVPKIAFTDPAVTKPIGRVSATQMASGRAAVIYFALQTIANDPKALMPRVAPPSSAVSMSVESNGEEPASSDGYDTRFGKIPMSPQLASFLNENRDMLTKVAVGLVILLVFMRLFRRRT